MKKLFNCLKSFKFASALVLKHVHIFFAKIAQLVERHLAKVEVAGSNPVFRSTTGRLYDRLVCLSLNAEVVELVDTLDLKSNGQKCPCGFKSRLLYKCIKTESEDSVFFIPKAAEIRISEGLRNKKKKFRAAELGFMLTL